MIPRRRIIVVIAGAIVLLLGLWYVGTRFQWKEIAAILATVRPGWLMASASLIPLFWAVRAARCYVLLKRADVPLSYGDIYLSTAVALGLSFVTPFQSGELVKIELLKKHAGVARYSGLGSLFIERLADLFILFSLAAIGLTIIPVVADRPRAMVAAAIMITILATIAIVVWKVPFSGRVAEFQRHLHACVTGLPMLLGVMALTLLSWVIVGCCWNLALLSVGIEIGTVKSTLLAACTAVLNALSCVPGGVGIAEAAISLMLRAMGVSTALAQAGSLIIRGFSLMVLGLGALHCLVLHWRSRTRAWSAETATVKASNTQLNSTELP